MKDPKACQSKEEIREAIDVIDNQIVNLLGARFQYVTEIVKFKSHDRDSIVAQERYNAVIHKVRALAEKNNISPEMIEKMYRFMMDYNINEEFKIMDKIKK